MDEDKVRRSEADSEGMVSSHPDIFLVVPFLVTCAKPSLLLPLIDHSSKVFKARVQMATFLLDCLKLVNSNCDGWTLNHRGSGVSVASFLLTLRCWLIARIPKG